MLEVKSEHLLVTCILIWLRITPLFHWLWQTAIVEHMRVSDIYVYTCVLRITLLQLMEQYCTYYFLFPTCDKCLVQRMISSVLFVCTSVALGTCIYYMVRDEVKKNWLWVLLTFARTVLKVTWCQKYRFIKELTYLPRLRVACLGWWYKRVVTVIVIEYESGYF